MKYLIPSFMLLCTASLQAQSTKFSFKLGMEYELPRRTEDLAFVGMVNHANLQTTRAIHGLSRSLVYGALVN